MDTAEHALTDVRALAQHEPALVLSEIDLSASISSKEYMARIRPLQLELVNLQRRIGDYGLRVILVFEGMDAAGKGGTIRRLIQYLDPRGYRVHSLGQPGPADIGHHYLRRFWMRLPKRGRITIFDDYSWYARLLMDPVEHYCTPEQYQRAPAMVRSFEQMLAEEGYVLLKFWIHVDREEQHKRFRRRLSNPYKSWKMTPEDWRNRAKFDSYMQYAQAMIDSTDEPHAPWFAVAGNDKRYARVQVLEITSRVLARWPVTVQPVTYRHQQLQWLDEHGDVIEDD